MKVKQSRVKYATWSIFPSFYLHKNVLLAHNSIVTKSQKGDFYI